MQKHTTLVTGASGFIGTKLCNFLKNDCLPVVRSCSSHKYEKFFEISNIDSETDWSAAFDSISTVVHLAGLAHSSSYTEQEYTEINVEGTLNLARQASLYKVKRFVFLSTIGVTGTNSDASPITECSQPNPQNAYSKSKYDAERKLIEFCSGKMELVIVRPPLVYGLDAPGNFASLCKLVRNTKLLPFGAISNQRSFISIYNLVDFCSLVIKDANAANQIFVVCDKKSISTSELINKLINVLNLKCKNLRIPEKFLYYLFITFRKQKLADQLLSNLLVEPKKAENILGWEGSYDLKMTLNEDMNRLSENNSKS